MANYSFTTLCTFQVADICLRVLGAIPGHLLPILVPLRGVPRARRRTVGYAGGLRQKPHGPISDARNDLLDFSVFSCSQYYPRKNHMLLFTNQADPADKDKPCNLLDLTQF